MSTTGISSPSTNSNPAVLYANGYYWTFDTSGYAWGSASLTAPSWVQQTGVSGITSATPSSAGLMVVKTGTSTSVYLLTSPTASPIAMCPTHYSFTGMVEVSPGVIHVQFSDPVTGNGSFSQNGSFMSIFSASAGTYTVYPVAPGVGSISNGPNSAVVGDYAVVGSNIKTRGNSATQFTLPYSVTDYITGTLNIIKT
jgi:hypothetical protein